MARCVYCGEDGKVTKEEVLPLFLSRNRPTYRTVVDHGRRLVRKGVVAAVKDVCEQCNGVILSRLDNYAAGLDREYFSKIVFSLDIEFEYDYRTLLRWLLKVFYNDDRTKLPPYETLPYVPFILGNQVEPYITSTIFLGLIAPSITSVELQRMSIPRVIEPELCSVGYMGYDEPAKSDITFSRFVQVNSYLFNVLGWRETVSRPVRRHHIAKICQQHLLFELRPSDKSVFISAAAMDFLTFRARFLESRLGYRDIRTGAR